MVWIGTGMNIPKKYTSIAWLHRKLIAITSPITVAKELGAHCFDTRAIAVPYTFIDRQTDRVGSKDHVATRLRTSEKEVNENIVPNRNWERNSGSQNVNYMNRNPTRVTRQKFTTQPDGKHDGSLEPLANWSRTGLFVSTNEKLQTTEHNRACWSGKEMRACFIVVGFQKCPLL